MGGGGNPRSQRKTVGSLNTGACFGTPFATRPTGWRPFCGNARFCRVPALTRMDVDTRENPMRHDSAIQCLFTTFFALPTALPAATLCVGDAAGLQGALHTAATNGDSSNTIKVRSGTYAAPTGGFFYSRSSGSASLDIEGGWNAGCTVQMPDASLTLLDGQSLTNVLDLADFVSIGTQVTVRYLDLRNGVAPGVPRALAIAVEGEFHVDHCRFKSNHADAPGSGNSLIYLNTVAGPIHFDNNVVSNNTAMGSDHVIAFDLGSGAGDVTFYINNNTIADNVFDTSTASSGAVLLRPDAHSLLANNILWGNGGREFAQNITVTPMMLNNDVDVLNVTPAAGSSGNLGRDPHFAGVSDHHLVSGTPLYNAGYAAPPGGFSTLDLDGNARVAFGAVDIGAYELQSIPDEIFKDGFDDG
jgi:hypothetical protein